MNNLKKIVMFSLFIGLCAEVKSFWYMNGEAITFRSIITGHKATSIDYNIVHNGYGYGDGCMGGDKRLFGVHNMSITIPGYEVIHLIQDDVCLHPNLFTMLSWILKDSNFLTQRYACVKWWMPLSFGFKVQNDVLIIQSSIWKYRLLAPFRATKKICLIKTAAFDHKNQILDKELPITVSVNGRTVVADQKTVVQIYSISALEAAAIPYIFWPLL